jgi:hypothetical protein
LGDCRSGVVVKFGMPALTRRRYPERPDSWHVHCGDVQVGSIARRAGCPVDVDKWEWGCGFYPGTNPREAAAHCGDV